MPAHNPVPARRASPNAPRTCATTSTPAKTSSAPKCIVKTAKLSSKKLSEAVLQDLRQKTIKTQQSLDKLMSNGRKPLLSSECPAAPVTRAPASLEKEMNAPNSSIDDLTRTHILITNSLKEAREQQLQSLAGNTASTTTGVCNDTDIFLEDSDADSQEDGATVSSVQSDEVPDYPQAQESSNSANMPTPEPSSHTILVNHGMISPIEIIDRAIVLLGPDSFSNKVISENLLIFETGNKENMEKLVNFFKSKGFPFTINPTPPVLIVEEIMWPATQIAPFTQQQEKNRNKGNLLFGLSKLYAPWDSQRKRPLLLTHADADRSLS
ncbi:hypothetical protein ACLKA7_004859 [Drosophila subpalustris]